MSRLTWLDRASTFTARWLERPILAAIPSQPVLRAIFEATAPLGQKLPAGCKVNTLETGDLLIVPRGCDGAPLMLYLHGGAFTLGSPRTHRALAAHIGAAAGLRVLSLDYPLAPEHPYPAANEAVYARYLDLLTSGDAPVAVAGDSAGGALTLSLAQRLRDADQKMPRAMALISPLCDLSIDPEAAISSAPSEYLIPIAWARRAKRAYLAGQSPLDPRVSPGLGTLSSLPPCLIHSAQGEALEPRIRALADQLDQAELVSWPGLHHAWHLKAGRVAAATRACREIGLFIRRHL